MRLQSRLDAMGSPGPPMWLITYRYTINSSSKWIAQRDMCGFAIAHHARPNAQRSQIYYSP